jgi:hypothetical protein
MILSLNGKPIKMADDGEITVTVIEITGPKGSSVLPAPEIGDDLPILEKPTGRDHPGPGPPDARF